MITLDMRGYSCPEPALKTKNAIDKYKSSKETILVIVDNGSSKDNVIRIGIKNGYKVETREDNGEYKLTLSL